MANEPNEKNGIAREGKRRFGYNPEQVDAFLERAHALYDSEDGQLTQGDIQSVSFDLVKGGYVIAQVDAALSRLERAVVDKQTTREIATHGRVAWKAQTESLYRAILSHVERVEGQRFMPGKPKQPSYDRKQVDRLTDQVVDKAASELGVDGVTKDDVRELAKLDATSVANAVFTQRKGKHGYDERQVDYFLSSCVQLLSRLESYARVADYVGDPSSESAASGLSVSVAQPASVAPLREANGAPQQVAAPMANSESFDALHQAERDLFTAPAQPDEPSGMQAVPAPASEATPVPAPAFEAAPTPAAASETASAPKAVPVPAQTAHDDAKGDSALASLAQMAQEEPVDAMPTFTPSVPDLSAPSVTLDDAPAPVVPAPPAFAPSHVRPSTVEPPMPSAPVSQPHMADAQPVHPTEPVAKRAPTTEESVPVPPAPADMPVSFAPTHKPEGHATPAAPVAPASSGNLFAPQADDQDNRSGKPITPTFPPLINVDDDFGLPDLSFPTFTTDDSDEKKDL